MKKINKYSLIKVAGVFTICLVTFLNSQSSIVLSDNQGTLDLNKLVSMTQANAEWSEGPTLGGIGCIGWGVVCRSILRPEQTEVFWVTPS